MLALVCVMLSYSRGTLLALALGLAFWFAVVPLRLRGAAVLLATGVAAALVTAWAFAQPDLTRDNLALGVRSDAGVEFGALLVLLSALLLLAGLAWNFRAELHPPTVRTRRRAGWTLVALLALVP